MKTKIIAGFPGTGKSTYHRKHPDTTLDSDSSSFSWIITDEGKIRNPDFPSNYIEHIRSSLDSNKYDYIFVRTHKEVRDALTDAGIPFIIAYPPFYEKDRFLKKYKLRGSPQAFIDLIDKNWNEWIADLDNVNKKNKNRYYMSRPYTIEKFIKEYKGFNKE